jgi:prolyl 4-hydroxylase
VQEKSRLNELEKRLEEYRRMRDAASQSRERFVANPLNSFLLIKKLTSEWKEVQGLIQGGHGERLLQNITQERINVGLRWPSDEDLNGAAVGGSHGFLSLS